MLKLIYMLCPKCNKENLKVAKTCFHCGEEINLSMSRKTTTFGRKEKIIVALFSLLFCATVLGIFIFYKNRMSKVRNGISGLLNTNLVGEQIKNEVKNIENKEEEDENECKKIEQELLEKHEQDYESCRQKIEELQEPDCVQPDKFGDSFKENLNIIIILDSSGSMAQSVSGGIKMAIAKKVVNDFAKDLPGRAKVGLLVYGHKGSNRESDKAESCKGIETIYSLSELDANKFSSAVDSFSPTGWTPIADSLKEAKTILEALESEENSSIIYLVSDGKETCDGDPVTAARELQSSDIKAMVNIIGFSVNDEAQKQLKQAADAGGGDYYSANDAKELEKVFNDNSKYLEQLTDYRNCIQKHATKNREKIQKLVTEVKDCLQEKATTEKDSIQKQADKLKEENKIDRSCWYDIYYGARKKWYDRYYGARREWYNKFYGAQRNWYDIYYGIQGDWYDKYYGND